MDEFFLLLSAIASAIQSIALLNSNSSHMMHLHNAYAYDAFYNSVIALVTIIDSGLDSYANAYSYFYPRLGKLGTLYDTKSPSGGKTHRGLP